MKNVKPWQSSVLAVVTLVALASSATAADPENDYANQTPYGTPNASIEKAPDGYSMIFLETIGRHGSRSLTSDGTERSVLDVWQRASDQGALAKLGGQLKRDVEAFQEAEKKIGYGKLSGVGHEEWQGIGHRDAETYAPFFDAVHQKGDKIATVTTSVERTQQSAEALHAGLTEVNAGLKKALEPAAADKVLRLGNHASPAGRSDHRQDPGRRRDPQARRAPAQQPLLGRLRQVAEESGRRGPRHPPALLDRRGDGQGH